MSRTLRSRARAAKTADRVVAEGVDEFRWPLDGSNNTNFDAGPGGSPATCGSPDSCEDLGNLEFDCGS